MTEEKVDHGKNPAGVFLNGSRRVEEACRSFFTSFVLLDKSRTGRGFALSF